ncbi:MAG: DUF951 domain-containing protein [Oscillospiraceae bacterium]|nr:DUF951 domain-containing protein [Oscillospiraceae bacterium]
MILTCKIFAIKRVLVYNIVATIHLYIKERSGGSHTDVQVGDVIITKKPHPCGTNSFDVLRVGMDFKIRCKGCQHEVMVPRAKIEKNIKRVVREALPL